MLPPGPYAVGFESRDLYDYTRAYRGATTASGRPEARERARLVMASIWYPAARSAAAPMRYGDYFPLWAHQGTAPTPAEVARAVARFESFGLPKARLDSIRSGPTRAVRNARPAQGKFPVIIYSPGGRQVPWDNSVLFEYLASHGFVVIGSPSTWNWERMLPVGTELASAEAAARDMEFHLGFSRALPFTDQDRIALMGYSWGGLAGPIVASRNNRISAVVNLDGSVRYFNEVYRAATHHDPAEVRAAFLQLSASLDRTRSVIEARGGTMDSANVASYTMPFEFYQQLRYVDAYHATMVKFHHGHFASANMILSAPPKPGEPTHAEDREGYAVLARYVLAFLTGYLKGDTAARAWLSRSPAENGIPDGIVTLESKPASPVPAPTIEGFARYARRHGIDRLKALVDSVRKTDSTYDLTEETASYWAGLLKVENELAMGRAVLDWNIERRPSSPGALGALCYWLDARAERRECFVRLLAIDPMNENAKSELAELGKPSSP
jgi:dienelactone hydrolase